MDAWDKSLEIARSNEVVFIKRPVFENRKIIFNLGKSYVKSDILFDSTDKFYGIRLKKDDDDKRLTDFPEEIELGSVISQRPAREIDLKQKEREKEEENCGYCIRSGEKIKFNPLRPMSVESWKVWNEYGNEDFRENYCHKTGQRSHGKTSMRHPIM